MSSIQRQGTQEIEEHKPDDTKAQWGKLLSLNKAKLNSYDLKNNEVSIGRLPENTIQINDVRLSGVHCKLTFDPEEFSIKLKDFSTNGTFLGDQRIGKGNEVLLKTGDEFFILHRTKVIDTDILGFAFVQTLFAEVKTSSSIIVEVPNKQLEEQNKQNEERIKKMDELGEDFHCPICDDLVYQAITLMPCLHNFCGSCFSDWMAKQKTCPTCRMDVEVVKKNATINSLVEKYLQANPAKKRPDAEYEQMDKNNKIKQDAIKFNKAPIPVPIFGPPPISVPIIPAPINFGFGAVAPIIDAVPARGRSARQKLKRKVSDYSADSGDEKDKQTGDKFKDCGFCKKQTQGFKCGPLQQHTKCLNCRRHFPDRQLTQEQNEQFFHKCGICNVFICNLVFPDCLRLNRGNRQLNLLRNMPIPSNLTVAIFRENGYEYKVLRDYMTQNKLTTQSIMKHMLRNYIEPGHLRYIVNKRIIANSIEETNIRLSPNTPICTNCEASVWFQLVFRYRISIREELPQLIKARPQCWYGINCSTMRHKQDHAEKLDHIGEQTKF